MHLSPTSKLGYLSFKITFSLLAKIIMCKWKDFGGKVHKSKYYVTTIISFLTIRPSMEHKKS